MMIERMSDENHNAIGAAFALNGELSGTEARAIGMRAACASVRPEDVTDEMVVSFVAAWPLYCNTPRDEIMRRAIAAAINAAGSKSPAG